MVDKRSLSRPLAGRYRLIRHIAKGGMADVWLADDESLNRRVAVKLLRSHLVHDETLAERFRREAVACAGINHPNIVAVYDCIEHEGRQAVIMQYVEGKSLREVLDRRPKLGPQLTIHIGVSVAGALDEAHRHQIIHRDVKPGNVLFDADGTPYLADFGVATVLDQAAGYDAAPGEFVGTAAYASPEQCLGMPLTGASDQYALAVVAYQMLAGRRPFDGPTALAVISLHLSEPPPDPLAHNPALPGAVRPVLERALAKRPEERYPSVLAFSHALDVALALAATPGDEHP